MVSRKTGEMPDFDRKSSLRCCLPALLYSIFSPTASVALPGGNTLGREVHLVEVRGSDRRHSPSSHGKQNETYAHGRANSPTCETQFLWLEGGGETGRKQQ
uniref:Uncharacterized protein n=1 Tax=Sphaerodactylus townsendi TaxID=933632 RepID=A0ACB8G9V8_9SAUR